MMAINHGLYMSIANKAPSYLPLCCTMCCWKRESIVSFTYFRHISGVAHLSLPVLIISFSAPSCVVMTLTCLLFALFTEGYCSTSSLGQCRDPLKRILVSAFGVVWYVNPSLRKAAKTACLMPKKSPVMQKLLVLVLT